jgi:hypothetical protein
MSLCCAVGVKSHFVYLITETTAHTFAAALSYLAINPDIQQEILDHIISVVGWDGKPVREYFSIIRNALTDYLFPRLLKIMANLTKSLPCSTRLFDYSVRRHEDSVNPRAFTDIRLLASGHLMFRKATKDTTLQVPRPLGQEGSETIAISKGTTVVIDMIGIRK